MMRLIVTREGRTVSVGPLPQGRTVLGNDRCADILLPEEPFVSREQCVIRHQRGRLYVTDTSSQGTHLDGVRLVRGQEVPLAVTSVLGFFGLTAHIEIERSAGSPIPTRKVEDAFEVLIRGTTEAAEAHTAVLLFRRGPRKGERIPLLTRRATIGGPADTVPLGLPHTALVVHVEYGRSYLEPTGHARVLLGDGPLRRASGIERSDLVTIGAHGFSIRREQLWSLTPPAAAVGGLVGRAQNMCQLFGAIERAAPHDLPVLIVGPTGSGKDLVARAVHELSLRPGGPFVSLNCGALNEALAGSELFGHEKGAFTGASERTNGAFRDADGGTLFLDELGELPLGLQATLLRALADGEVRRVGSTKVDQPKVRVICATHRDLARDVQDGRFREDLFFRTAGLVLRTPSLAERIEDLPLLAETLLARHHPGAAITPAALRRLMDHDWPGNVRELRLVLLRAFVDAPDGRIDARHVRFNHEILAATPPPPPFTGGGPTLVPRELREYSNEELRELNARFSEREVADQHGVSRGSARYWLQKAARAQTKSTVPPR